MLERNITNENNNKNNNVDAYSNVIKIQSKFFISSVKEDDTKHLLESRKCIKEDSNYVFSSNFNNLDLNNNLSHTNLIDENNKGNESLPFEELFLKQKEKIKFYKEKTLKNKKDKNLSQKLSINKSVEIINSENNISNKLNNISNNFENRKTLKSQKKIFNGTFKILTLENYQFFEKTTFQTKITNFNEDEKIPILKNVEWKSISNSMNNIQFRNLAIRTINEINYETNMVQVSANFTLMGKSEFWIFTRSFVNKNVNESFNFELSSLNNEPDIVFNKYSSLIKIIKESNNKCFITFGTFCESSKDPTQVSYKTFLKRQLVNFNENDNLKYLEDDICEFNILITDWGSEKIEAKIGMNSDSKYNYILGNFYIPTNKRSKILLCGEGESIIVNKLIINNLDKKEEEIQQFETIFSKEQKSCTCCLIF